MYAQAGFAIAQVKVPPQEIPLAIGFISLAQIGGATIALAIANSVFLNKATSGILAVLPDLPLEVVQGAVSGAGSTFFQTLDESVRPAVLEAVADAIQSIYILAITGAALSIVLACFMSREKVRNLPNHGSHDASCCGNGLADALYLAFPTSRRRSCLGLLYPGRRV